MADWESIARAAANRAMNGQIPNIPGGNISSDERTAQNWRDSSHGGAIGYTGPDGVTNFQAQPGVDVARVDARAGTTTVLIPTSDGHVATVTAGAGNSLTVSQPDGSQYGVTNPQIGAEMNAIGAHSITPNNQANQHFTHGLPVLTAGEVSALTNDALNTLQAPQIPGQQSGVRGPRPR